MHILQTRPQGERSAVEALARRGIEAISPTETIVVRRHLKGGKSECVERPVKLLPSYIAATPASQDQLDRATTDMDLREPRKDIIRRVGRVSDAAMAHIISRHGGVKETDAKAPLAVGMVARITAGAFQGFQVRIQAMRGNKARVQVGPLPADVPLEHLEPVAPQRHPPT